MKLSNKPQTTLLNLKTSMHGARNAKQVEWIRCVSDVERKLTTDEFHDWLAARLEVDSEAALRNAEAGSLAIILRTGRCVCAGGTSFARRKSLTVPCRDYPLFVSFPIRFSSLVAFAVTLRRPLQRTRLVLSPSSPPRITALPYLGSRMCFQCQVK